MDYRIFGDKTFVRIDKGEEIVSTLKSVCEKEKITLASVTAIGAIGRFTVGVFLPETKTYISKEYAGHYEIVSLMGNVTAKDGETYIHVHMSAGDESGAVVGGHLNEAHVAATCEMVLDTAKGTVERTFSDDIGLNLLDFEKAEDRK